MCYGSPDALRVVDVYATVADFEAFAATLVPVLTRLGVDPGKPTVQPVLDVVRGA